MIKDLPLDSSPALNDPFTLLLLGITASFVILGWIFRRRLTSPRRQVDRLLGKLPASELSTNAERTDWQHAIIPKPNGFSVRPLSDSSPPEVSLDWDSVHEAIAFKKDLWSTDCVCIAFLLGDGSRLEVHEEMKGWAELCEGLPGHLAGAPVFADWFRDITTPAFELNPTILFRRGESATGRDA